MLLWWCLSPGFEKYADGSEAEVGTLDKSMFYSRVLCWILLHSPNGHSGILCRGECIFLPPQCIYQLAGARSPPNHSVNYCGELAQLHTRFEWLQRYQEYRSSRPSLGTNLKAPPLYTASLAGDLPTESSFEMSQTREIIYGTLLGNRKWTAKGWLSL